MPKLLTKTCSNESCRVTFYTTRSNVRYCSNKCTKRQNRRNWFRKVGYSTIVVDRGLKKALDREDRLQNPTKYKLFNSTRRARVVAAEGSHTQKQWIGKVESLGWRCFYCNEVLDRGTLTKDHFIPLSKGGSNYLENLVPACKSCNSKKRDRLLLLEQVTSLNKKEVTVDASVFGGNSTFIDIDQRFKPQ